LPSAPTGAVPADELSAVASELKLLWHAIARGKYHSSGLDRQQYWVLAALENGPVRMSALADCAATSQASLTGIVDRLEHRALVERVRSSEDRRVIDVSLTPAGRETAQLMREHSMGGLEAILLRLDAEERSRFLELVRKLNRHSSDQPGLAE